MAETFDQAEFMALREFYQAWEAFHAVPADTMHRKRREDAAQAMVEKAHVLRRMKNEKPTVLVPRFTVRH